MGLLRFALALSVVLEHLGGTASMTLVDGVAAVQSFFMLSGFYMALVLSEKYVSIGPFYFNRALRILPTYFLVLAASIAIDGGDKLSRIISSTWDLPSKTMMIVANFGIFGSDTMMFSAPVNGRLSYVDNIWSGSPIFWQFHYIPQAWTLPLEILFYLMAPFIVRRIPVLFAICIASIGVRVWLHFHGLTNDPWNYRFFPAELVFFCAGSLAYHFYSMAFFRDAYRAGLGWTARFLALLLVVAFPFVAKAGFTHIPYAFYACILLLLPFLFLASKHSQADRFLGEFSYPLYISHFIITSRAEHLPILLLNPTVSSVLYCVALAALIHLAFETKIDRLFRVVPKEIHVHSPTATQELPAALS
jgi:peptidoglycan/LPS O-acetylase OafA/YrhL